MDLLSKYSVITMRNICIVAGARPNFIKVAPIVRALEIARKESGNVSYTLIYTGRNDDATLEQSLFDDLQIKRPTVFLGVDCESLNELTGRVMGEFEAYLEQNDTDVVVVVDDLASTMAAAIVTKKRGVKLAHLVAGTRSFDISMPKEINRLVIDGLSDLMFTAGVTSNGIATREGTEKTQVYMVGNILMDTLRFNHSRFKRPYILDELGIEDGKYLVFTLNRKALIKNNDNLQKMLHVVQESTGAIPVIAPLRGAARDSVKSSDFILTDAMSYLEFGYLTSHALGIITDSGNVAEEATFNNVPCITLNSYTEHIETVRYGTNVLVGEDADMLGKAVRDILAGCWKQASLPERWDGRTAERIVRILLDC